jgi:hypothetical protein
MMMENHKYISSSQMMDDISITNESIRKYDYSSYEYEKESSLYDKKWWG